MIFAGSFMTCTAQTEKLDEFFQSFENKSGVTSIDIKKPMFDLLNKIEINDEYVGKIKPIMRDVDGLKLLVFSKIAFPDHLKSENVGQIKMNEAKSKRVENLLANLNLNELMSMKSDDVSMKFLAENAKDGILENLIFNVDSKDEIVIFMLNGKMKMDDVNKIINSSDTTTNFSNTKTVRNSFNSENATSYPTGEKRNVGQFSGIHASSGVVINYKQENPTSVEVIADADKLQYIVTKVENGILNIYIDNKRKQNVNFKNLSINVSAPKMSEIKTSSGSVFNAINGISDSNFLADASSGSVINAKLNAEIVRFEISSGAVINSEINSANISMKGSSAGVANLKGKVKMGLIDVSSGAVVNAKKLEINTLSTESTSGAIVNVHVFNALNAKASSGGSIEYKGDPKVDADISKISGGSLQKVN